MDKIISLQNGHWYAEVVPSCGNNLISLCYDQTEILRKPDSLEALFQRPSLYGLPLLLPANRIDRGRFEFMGKEYELPINEPVRQNHIHGLLKDAPFSIVQLGCDYLVTSFRNSGIYYPFPFEIKIFDSLTEDGLMRRLELSNIGTMPMPYTLAFHATFVEPHIFAVGIGDRYEVNERHIPTGKMLNKSDTESAYASGFDPHGVPVSGFYTANENTAVIGDFELMVSQLFDNWVLFNGGGNQGYLCIEPQCGAVNGLNNGRCKVLEPGKQDIFVLTITKRGEA